MFDQRIEDFLFPPPLSQTPACCPRSPDPPGSPGNCMEIFDIYELVGIGPPGISMKIFN